MQFVLVLDQNKKPLDPCHPARARKLLGSGRAAVFRTFPFTIILKERVREESEVQEYRIKIDPGSRTTGMALVRENDRKVVWAAEIEHRGQTVRDRLADRRASRRGRRSRHCRYRPARFDNRRKRPGWLPPSLESRLANTQTWVRRLAKFVPVKAISIELVKFDTQVVQNPEIEGVEYQQGELAGYEVREYLLEKWARKCAYCGKNGVALEIEHIVPRSRGGTNRVGNLTLACHECNQRKGSRTAAEFGYPEIQEKAKQPLKDAAAVNATRWELWRRLGAGGLDMEGDSGGRTKFNRTRQSLPKTHWLDAACVGRSGERVVVPPHLTPLSIHAYGHGCRQMCRMDKFGFPRTGPKKAKNVKGFQTGDMVVALVKEGKKAGRYFGRVAVRSSGSFDIQTAAKKIAGVSHRYCRHVHRSDGYSYNFRKENAASSTR